MSDMNAATAPNVQPADPMAPENAPLPPAKRPPGRGSSCGKNFRITHMQ